MFDAMAPPHPRLVPPRQAPAARPAAVFLALALHGALLVILLQTPSLRLASSPKEVTVAEFVLEVAAEPEVPASAEPIEAAQPDPPPTPEAEPEPPPVAPEPIPPPSPVASFTQAAEPPRPAPRPPQTERRQARDNPATAAGAQGAHAEPSPAATPNAAPPLITTARFRRPPSPPHYSDLARERALSGTVVLRALVGPDGATRELRLHRSSGHAILDGSAMTAARKWQFEAATRDGQRMEAWVEVPIRFELR